MNDLQHNTTEEIKEKINQFWSQSNLLYLGDLDQDKWCPVYTRHRDSDLLNISNFETYKDILKREGFDSGDLWTIERFNHWGVGWTDHLFIKWFDDRGNLTTITETVEEINSALTSYPVLDEEDYDNRCREAQVEYIDSWFDLRGCDPEEIYRACLKIDQNRVYDSERDGYVPDGIVEQAIDRLA